MNPSPTAEAAREGARHADGKFGAQPKSESQVELDVVETPDFADIFPDPARAAHAQETYTEVESFLDGDGYLAHALELDDEGMADLAGTDTVMYATEDGALRVNVLSMGEDQFSVEMMHDDSGSRREESYGASEAPHMAADLCEFWGRE